MERERRGRQRKVGRKGGAGGGGGAQESRVYMKLVIVCLFKNEMVIEETEAKKKIAR